MCACVRARVLWLLMFFVCFDLFLFVVGFFVVVVVFVVVFFVVFWGAGWGVCLICVFSTTLWTTLYD